LLKRLTNEKGDLIFETKPKLFSIGTFTNSNEIVSLLSIKMLKVRVSGESDLEPKKLQIKE
jgi:hypothetical protein